MKRTLHPMGGFALGLALFSIAAPARAQVRAGIEVDQGVYWPGSYALNLVAAPGYDFGRFRLAAGVGATLENPKWAFLGGIRPSFVLWAPVTPETGVRLVGEASYVGMGGWRALGGAQVDLDSVHIGVSAGYDSVRDGPLVMTTLGLDLLTLVTFFASNPLGSTPPCGH